MKKASLWAVVIISFLTFSQDVWAWNYFESMVRAHRRGVTNLTTGVLEIPYAVQEAHGHGSGLKYVDAAVQGTGKCVVRTLSGAWDLPAGFLPGFQQGIHPNPETLFSNT